MVSAADVWGEVKIPHISFLSQTSLRRVKPTWGDGRKSRPNPAMATVLSLASASPVIANAVEMTVSAIILVTSARTATWAQSSDLFMTQPRRVAFASDTDVVPSFRVTRRGGRRKSGPRRQSASIRQTQGPRGSRSSSA